MGITDQECVFQAFICAYSSCDLSNIMKGCKVDNECLCVKSSGCLAVGEDAKAVGLKAGEDGNICELGLYCLTYACKVPELCIWQKASCLCINTGAALPFKDPVPEATCAVCFLRCLPYPVGLMMKPGGKESALNVTLLDGAPPMAENIDR